MSPDNYGKKTAGRVTERTQSSSESRSWPSTVNDTLIQLRLLQLKMRTIGFNMTEKNGPLAYSWSRKRVRQIRQWGFEQIQESLIVNENYHTSKQRKESAYGTFTTNPSINSPAKTKIVASTRQEERKYEKIILEYSNPQNEFTKARLDDDVKGENRQHESVRKVQLAMALLAGQPLENPRVKRTTPGRWHWKYPKVVPTAKCGAARYPHATFIVKIAPPATRVFKERQRIAGLV